MAKSKPLAKNASKRFASKAAVQKNGKPSSKPRREIHQYEEKAKSFPKRRMKVAAQQKPRKKSEDPLAVAFTASLEASRAFLYQRAEASVTTTHQDLVQQVNTSNTHFEQETQTINKSSEGVRKPLEQDQLRFVGKDGKSAGTQRLGDRMKKFKDVVAAEKKKINDLAKQWAEINQSMTRLALEVVGPEGIDDLISHLNGELPGYAIPQDNSFEEEVQSKTNRFKSEITKANETMILQTETYEEEMKDMRRKQMANLLSVMAAEI